jgi:hypothetical protein
MVPAYQFDALIQSVAALLIFVIGYIALLLSAIPCLLTAALIAKVVRLIWTHIVQAAAPACPVSSSVAGDTPRLLGPVASVNRHLAAAHKSGPHNLVKRYFPFLEALPAFPDSALKAEMFYCKKNQPSGGR